MEELALRSAQPDSHEPKSGSPFQSLIDAYYRIQGPLSYLLPLLWQAESARLMHRLRAVGRRFPRRAF